MSKRYEAKGAGIPDSEGSMKAWYSHPLFERIQSQQWLLGGEDHEQYLVFYFYPEPSELRQRLAALEGNPAPILEAVKNWCSLPGEQGRDRSHLIPRMLQEMRHFIDCYEKAFANKSEWKPVFRRLDEGDDEEEEIDSALPPDPDESSNSEDGEAFVGRIVKWDDPSLLEVKYEKTPSRRHREPYIILW